MMVAGPAVDVEGNQPTTSSWFGCAPALLVHAIPCLHNLHMRTKRESFHESHLWPRDLVVTSATESAMLAVGQSATLTTASRREVVRV